MILQNMSIVHVFLTWLLTDFCLAAITPHQRHHHRHHHHGNQTAASQTEVMTGTVLAALSTTSDVDKDVDTVEYGVGGTRPSSTSPSTESRGSTTDTDDMMADDW